MIAITGFGVVSAAGAGVESHLEATRSGRSCLIELDGAVAAGLPVRFGGRAPIPLGEDRVLGLARPALEEALESAGMDDALRARAGLALGSGLGCMERTEALLAEEHEGPLRDLHPHAITAALAQRYGLGGPRGTYTVTCASALYALEQACADLEAGRAPVMVCGGLETLSRTILAGFCALDALSKTASSDLPSPNDGIVLGEGACFLTLEPLDAARARRARVRGLVRGRALRSDGVHMTSPDTAGAGMRAAVSQALAEASLLPADVERVTLTAPAAPAYQELYDNALAPLMGEGWRQRATSWEPSLGHVLGASGALGLLHASLLLEGALGPAPRDVLALTVGFGGLNGATVISCP